jgi:hypothetical protein
MKGNKKAGALVLLVLLGGGLLLFGKKAEAVDPPLPEPLPDDAGNVITTPTPVIKPADSQTISRTDLLALLRNSYPTPASLSSSLDLPAILLALGTVESNLTLGALGDYVNGLPTSYGIWQVHQPTWASTAGAFPVGASAAVEVGYIKPLVDDLTATLVTTIGKRRGPVSPALVASLIWEFGSTRVKNWAKPSTPLTQDSFRSYFQSATGNSVDKFYPKASGFADRQSKMETAYDNVATVKQEIDPSMFIW